MTTVPAGIHSHRCTPSPTGQPRAVVSSDSDIVRTQTATGTDFEWASFESLWPLRGKVIHA
jgi:hypothetical protein